MISIANGSVSIQTSSESFPSTPLSWLLPSLRRILLPLLHFLCEVSCSSLPCRGIVLGISVRKPGKTQSWRRPSPHLRDVWIARKMNGERTQSRSLFERISQGARTGKKAHLTDGTVAVTARELHRLLPRCGQLADVLPARLQHSSTPRTAGWLLCGSASYLDCRACHRSAFHQPGSPPCDPFIHFLFDFLQRGAWMFLSPATHLSQHFLRQLIAALLILCFHLSLLSLADPAFRPILPCSFPLCKNLTRTRACHPCAAQENNAY
jgi:hypothetical protein